jgi:hypothetical protein
VSAAVRTARRLVAVLHAVLSVTRSHGPRWLIVVAGIALAIPGPIDELIVVVLIGVTIWRRPVMRAAMIAAVRAAWATQPVSRRNHTGGRSLVAVGAIVAALLGVPMVAPAIATADGIAVIGHGRHAVRCALVGGVVVCRPAVGTVGR